GVAPKGLALADWYMDGIPDVVVATPTSFSTRLDVKDVQFLMGGAPGGTANGTLSAPAPAPAVRKPISFAVADLTTDGLADLVVLDALDSGYYRVGVLPGTCSRGVSKTMTVTSPNGGEVWDIGSTHTLSWTRGAGILSVDVQLSRDGGQNWETLARN